MQMTPWKLPRRRVKQRGQRIKVASTMIFIIQGGLLTIQKMLNCIYQGIYSKDKPSNFIRASDTVAFTERRSIQKLNIFSMVTLI